MGFFFRVSAFLAFCSSPALATPLETLRDRELNDILVQTREASKQPFLTEKSSQLNQLRRDYFERLSRPDWAADIQLQSLSGIVDSKNSFTGITADLRTLFQFSTNWQVQSSWSLSQELTRFAPLQYRAASELPTLNSLWLSYGKMRSVSLSAGLREEQSLLLERNPRPIFSGLAVAIHPLEQKLIPESLQSVFELEHGWTSLLGAPRTGAKRVEIQRTRPRLKLNWKFAAVDVAFATGLEWYTDAQGELRQISGNRPNASEESRASVENRWRLFSMQSHLRWQALDSSATLKFERVSNTLGASSTPAWSATLGGEIQIQQNRDTLTGLYGATYYRSPSGAVPSFRLPLEINPGTQGLLMTLGLNYFPSSHPNNSYRLGLTRSLKRKLNPEAWITCSTVGHDTPTNCRTDWVTLAWALKLPTNL